MSLCTIEVKDILEKLSKELLSGPEVAEIFGDPKVYPTKLIEDLSIETAKRYWKGEIDFGDGDCIMNNLQSYWVTNDDFVKHFEFGRIAWECYEAFDAGEYLRSTDDSEIDPAEKYTKPLIERLLRREKIVE